METNELEARLGWHAPDGSLRIWWDPAVPLPPALIDALRIRFPEAPSLAPDGDPQAPSALPPTEPAALAPGLVECFLEYAAHCQMHEDWDGMRAVARHFAAAVRTAEEVALASANQQITSLAHRLRGAWVRLLYTVGR